MAFGNQPVTVIGVLPACGHSEEEWQAKLRENQTLQNQLNAEKVRSFSHVVSIRDPDTPAPVRFEPSGTPKGGSPP